MKKLVVIACLSMAVCAGAQAQSSPGKKELVAKILQLQQPALEAMARNLAERPVAVLLQRARNEMQTRIPPDKRDAVAKDIQADVKKYADEAVPLLRERALRLAPGTIGVLLDERFTEDELEQVIAIIENPAYRKFQQAGGDMDRSLVEKLIADSRGVIDPKIRALELAVAGHLGIPVTAPAAGPSGGPRTGTRGEQLSDPRMNARSADLAALLGVRLPIIQAPMAGVQGVELALAVASAGALGSLPCAMLSPEALRDALQRIRAQAGAVVNINFFCHVPPSADPQQDAHWRAALSPHYRAWGLDPDMPLPAATRAPFDARAAALVEEFRPGVVSFHFGLPGADLLARVRASGARVLSSATTVQEGLWLQAHGADAVIAQGLEAGGHRGMFLSEDLESQVGTLALVAQLVQALDVPVIAAGGIADAAGVTAALALGASGVQVGTAYLLCPEASTSALHRAALQHADARHTALTRLFTGRPARGIVNRLMRELGPMSPLAPAFPLASAAIGPLRARAEAAGSTDFTPLWAGQNAAACRAMPAAELTLALAEGL